MLKILLLCGGKGKERDISLNSVRSAYDHIKGLKTVNLTVIFYDIDDKKYLIDEEYLYSNTSDDFRFLLKSNVSPMDDNHYHKLLTDCDLVFPIIHGVGGEDGKIQHFLEKNNIPFIGSPSTACEKMYNKHHANDQIHIARNMPNIPKLFISSLEDNRKNAIHDFISAYGSVCIKPVEGGSSIGVSFAKTAEAAIASITELLKEYHEVVMEKQCIGKEFTIIILDNNGLPIALMPTEIELKKGGSFDQRRKYMSTTEVRYYCPARFDNEIINNIRSEAEELFRFVGAKDFLRIDGWLLEDGSIYFSDFNPISGMEQNSFIFQQATKIGFTHGTLLEYILRNACRHYHISYPKATTITTAKRRVNILLGGITSERQVSLLSGTNVWMKLLHSDNYAPVPYILTSDDNNHWKVCEIPYWIALLHTTEEIIEQIDQHSNPTHLINEIQQKLECENINMASNIEWISLESFVKMSKKQNAYIFIGLHGGFGENGGIQSVLDQLDMDYNGSGTKASKLCMDKYKTGTKVTELSLEHLRTCKKIMSDFTVDWNELTAKLGTPIIAKPNGDGCSTGVVKLKSEHDLHKYIEFFRSGKTIPADTFDSQPDPIAMGSEVNTILFEEYIKTDSIKAEHGELKYHCETGWVELTIGVLEKCGNYHALNPSVAVAENEVLTVEEKFQGGTGINLTPPPENMISKQLKNRIKYFAECVAKKCNIEDYCRIDMFANNKTEEVIVIEINTLPGLSPSTVLFQQAAKETPALSPLALLERIMDSKEDSI